MRQIVELRRVSSSHDDLAQLIASGDQSRHHVENEVTILEQRVLILEQELKSKSDQNSTDASIILEQRFQATEQRFGEILTLLGKMETELNTTKDTLNQQTKNYDTLRRAFDKEKSNRHQIQQEYTELMQDYKNLSLKFTNLEEMFVNQTKEMVDTEQNLKALESDYNTTVAMVTSEGANFATSLTNIQTRLSRMNAAVISNKAAVDQLKQKSGYHSSFTVDAWPAPRAAPNDVTVFPNVISNNGGHYNPSSGRFTCEYDGVYYFSLHFYKIPSVIISLAYCYIRKNGVAQVAVNSNLFVGALTNITSFNEASTSVVLRLIKNDLVDVGSCSDISTIDDRSTFTGFLLRSN